MQKNILYVIIAICLSVECVHAQTILIGTVRDAKSQLLSGILLEVETKAQPPATAFVISAADGSFKLSLPAVPASDSLRLSAARALGYVAQLVRLANRSQPRALTSKPGSARDRARKTNNPLALR